MNIFSRLKTGLNLPVFKCSHFFNKSILSLSTLPACNKVLAEVDATPVATPIATPVAAPVAGAGVIPFKSIILKFAVAMGGVVVSLIVLWALLMLIKKRGLPFNNFKNERFRTLRNSKFASPKTVDDSIVFFINKNKL